MLIQLKRQTIVSISAFMPVLRMIMSIDDSNLIDTSRLLNEIFHAFQIEHRLTLSKYYFDPF